MIPYTTFTLANGLRVAVNHHPSTAMVAVNVIYNVGSRDEDPSLTGVAHLLEHLMFGGTEAAPDYDAAMERAGGQDNAWTSCDFTNYYSVAPAANIDTLLWLESDRMCSLALNERSLEVQRAVVMEEFRQTHLNTPYGDLDHHLRGLLYRSHPYGWPTIGKDLGHIGRATLENVEAFYRRHYMPGNAVLAISGNITADEARAKVEQWFGPLPGGEPPVRTYAPEPAIEAPRTLTVHGPVPQPMVVVAYPMDSYGTRGYVAADVITDVLASGRSSRMYRQLTMGEGLFDSADAAIAGSNEAGFMMLKGRLNDSSPEAVAQAPGLLVGQLSALTHVADGEHPSGLTASELERAVNRVESQHMFSMLTPQARAQELALAVMQGEDVNGRVGLYRSLTVDEVAAEAARLLDPAKACTLFYLPQE